MLPIPAGNDAALQRAAMKLWRTAAGWQRGAGRGSFFRLPGCRETPDVGLMDSATLTTAVKPSISSRFKIRFMSISIRFGSPTSSVVTSESEFSS